MTIYASAMPPVALSDLSITERLFQGLEGRPEAVVLTDGPTGRTVTAGEVIEGVRRLAGGLVARGQGKGTVTALMAPNLPEYVTIFHGVAYAGGTITTANPTYTAPELRHQLIDSGATLLITVPMFLAVAQAAVQGTSVSEIVVLGAAEGATPLAELMGPPLAAQVPVDVAEDVVALPYSSGTTGLPKGVMLTHRNLVVNVDQSIPMLGLEPGETTIAFLPFFHIYGLTALMHVYLAHGGALVTMPRFDLELFLRLTQDHKAKRLFVVPPVAIALAKHPLVAQFDLSSLVSVCSAAAPFGAELGETLGARLNCAAVQGYGMTELSPVSHFMQAAHRRPGSVGQTVASTETRIVDPETLRDVAPGAQGEVWVRGPQVMKGYLNRPEATAEIITAENWLRTGDVGSIDADGFLFIHDRLKELVKVNGFQVAPAELEALLLTHADVTDVAVIGVPDDAAGERPVAFVVARAGAQPTEAELIAFAAAQTATYKHLTRVSFVDSIPKSASGKILRRLLRPA